MKPQNTLDDDDDDDDVWYLFISQVLSSECHSSIIHSSLSLGERKELFFLKLAVWIHHQLSVWSVSGIRRCCRVSPCFHTKYPSTQRGHYFQRRVQLWWFLTRFCRQRSTKLNTEQNVFPVVFQHWRELQHQCHCWVCPSFQGLETVNQPHIPMQSIVSWLVWSICIMWCVWFYSVHCEEDTTKEL